MTKLLIPDDPNPEFRSARLSRIISASQSFCCLCEEPEDQGQRVARFNRALVAIEDNKGLLSVLWRSPSDKAEFRSIIDLAWRYQLETEPPRHMVARKIFS